MALKRVMFTVGFCSKFAKFMVRFDSFLTLILFYFNNSLSLMVEHHSSKMSILVRIQKRMYDLKSIAFIVTVFKNIVKRYFFF